MALSMRLKFITANFHSSYIARKCDFHTSASAYIVRRPEGKHPEKTKFPDEFTTDPPKGKIFDKKPFRIELEAGKKYAWCLCGNSKNQPLCDGSHRELWGTHMTKTEYRWRPLLFTVEETKDYWLCNCKQTNNRPFCDGTHKNEEIQKKIR